MLFKKSKNDNIIIEPELLQDKRLLKINTFSMAGLPVINMHYKFSKYIEKNSIIGDLVECGTCNGGSAAALGMGMGPARKIWLFDSFQGLPDIDEAKDGTDAKKYVGQCVGSQEQVIEALKFAEVNLAQVNIVPGWFSDTFPKVDIPAIALLHIDADWYDSVILALNRFYDAVSPGGLIILDDFAHWEGCREAFYDFVAQRNIKPVLERFGNSQAYWIKDKINNRKHVGNWSII